MDIDIDIDIDIDMDIDMDIDIDIDIDEWNITCLIINWYHVTVWMIYL